METSGWRHCDVPDESIFNMDKDVYNGQLIPIDDILIHVKDGLIWHVTMKKHLMKVVIEAGCMHLKYIITSLLLNASLLLPVVIPLFVHQSKWGP